MDKATQLKWDKASRTLDLFAFAEDRRLGSHKQRLFRQDARRDVDGGGRHGQ